MEDSVTEITSSGNTEIAKSSAPSKTPALSDNLTLLDNAACSDKSAISNRTNIITTPSAEIGRTVISNGHRDNANLKGEEAWGGEDDPNDSDDENQGLNTDEKILQDLANAKPEKKKKKKKKSGKKGLVLINFQQPSSRVLCMSNIA